MEKFKTYTKSLVAAVMLVVLTGLVGSSLVQAQDWRWDDRRDRRDDRWNDRRDRDRDRDYDRYGRNSGSRRDEEKGYRDGFDRGQEDARDRRIPTPNNSSHYRKGNDAYRYGFRQGYKDGYRRHWSW